MTAARCKAHQRGSHVRYIAVVDEVVSTPLSRRARLMGASALAGGALRGLAIAAGIVTAFGASPAFAQCASGSPPPATSLWLAATRPPRPVSSQRRLV